eukprot:6525362-Pyramimonas_sp.AAC.1
MTLFLAKSGPWSWSAMQVSARHGTIRRRSARRLACMRCDRSSTQMRRRKPGQWLVTCWGALFVMILAKRVPDLSPCATDRVGCSASA